MSCWVEFLTGVATISSTLFLKISYFFAAMLLLGGISINPVSVLPATDYLVS